MLLRPIDAMNLILILSIHQFSIQGREPYICDFIKTKRKKKLGCWLVFKHLQISFFQIWYDSKDYQLGMMIETTELYIFISLWMTLTIVQGHSCIRNEKLLCPMSHKFKYRFWWNLVCCHNLSVCWSACYIHFAQVVFKGGNPVDMILWNICLTSTCVMTLVDRFVSNLVLC